MSTVILRVSSADLDVDACIASIPTELVDTIWRNGDPRPGGRTCVDSGFTIVLWDEGHEGNLSEELLQSLRPVFPAVPEWVRRGAAVLVDVGVFQGPMVPTTIMFEARVLESLSSHGIAVAVSIYPCAD